jgi:Glycosyl hydrolase-like 10/Concanavalin A-like lectin/glucanases superfamily
MFELIAQLLVLASSATPTTLVNFDGAATRGWHRGGLELKPGQEETLQLTQALSTESGAVAFWTYPDPDEHRSYALVSARWGSPSEGYFAISQGWWEPLGNGRFHAIISNQDAAFCIADRGLRSKRWTQVTVSWRGGDSGYCRIYFDGEIVANNPVHIGKPRSVRARLAIGSDREAADRRGRDARGIFDEFQYFPRGLSDRDARALYQRAVPDERLRLRRAFDWAPPMDREGSPPERETRALFDESWQWARSRADVISLVDKAKRAGFNVLVVCVWHGRGAAWPSAIAHREPQLAHLQFDPLALLIEHAHRAGIEVHPWFTVALSEDDRHPEWRPSGTPAGAFDIHQPGFQRFMTDLIGEVVSRYAVDGINLDYIRAMGICRSDSCARHYAAHSGRNLLADITASTVRGPARAALEQWQDDSVRQLVTSIATRVRMARPNARISVAGHPRPLLALRALEGRAEVDWLRRGLIDALFAMEYGAIPQFENFTAVADEVGQPARLVWLFSNFDRLDGVAVSRPAAHLAEYIRFGRAHASGSGLAVYLRAMLTEEQIQALAAGPFRKRVPPNWPVREGGADP